MKKGLPVRCHVKRRHLKWVHHSHKAHRVFLNISMQRIWHWKGMPDWVLSIWVIWMKVLEDEMMRKNQNQ